MVAAEDDDEITSINVTPLVDIVLVLLIIFMVTARLISQRVLPMSLPKAAHTEAKPERTVRVALWKDGTWSLDDRKLPAEEAMGLLRGLTAANPDVKVTLAADQEVHWGRVSTVLDDVKGLGVRYIAAEVEPKPR